LDATNDKKENGGIIDLDVTDPTGKWPVYAGASFGVWNPDTGRPYGWADPQAAIEHLQGKRARQVRNKRSAFFGMDARWAADYRTLPCMSPRIAWRNVGRATDTRSFYATLLPPETLTAHHNYLLFFPKADHEREEAFILGVMGSIPFDWHARLWVEANFTANIVQPFPIPAAPRSDRMRHRVEQIAGRLIAVDERYADWAATVGVPVGEGDPSEDGEMVAELDAAVALLYGLSEAELRTVFATFHEGWDYEPRLSRVLKHFERLS